MFTSLDGLTSLVVPSYSLVATATNKFWMASSSFLQSVSSEEPVPPFELSRGSTISSDNGVFPLRSSGGDDHITDDDSLEDGESVIDDPVFVEPQVMQLVSFGSLLFPLPLKIFKITECRNRMQRIIISCDITYIDWKAAQVSLPIATLDHTCIVNIVGDN